MAKTVKHLPAMQETRVLSPGREDPLKKQMATHSRLLPRKFHGWRRLVGYSPWGRKELDMTEQLQLPNKRTPEVYCLIPSLTLKPTDSSLCRMERQSQVEAKLSTVATMEILFREIQV